MVEAPRLHAVCRLLSEHASSPLLRHIRDGSVIIGLAQSILRAVDGPGSPWEKWEKERDKLARQAAGVWVPPEDLQEALNRLPGPRLTETDVAQRVRAIHEEGGYPYSSGPDQELRDDCLAEYVREKAKGTEFMAILGWLEEWMWGVEERLSRKREEERKRRIAAEKLLAIQRLRSGTDCPWTQSADGADLYCRKSGRLFRLTEDKKARTTMPRFEVTEIKAMSDKRGSRIGQYRTRTEATKAVVDVAYGQP